MAAAAAPNSRIIGGAGTSWPPEELELVELDDELDEEVEELVELDEEVEELLEVDPPEVELLDEPELEVEDELLPDDPDEPPVEVLV